jgi:hypothetical protein
MARDRRRRRRRKFALNEPFEFQIPVNKRKIKKTRQPAKAKL